MLQSLAAVAVVHVSAVTMINPKVPAAETTLNRITFASCAHQDPEGFGSDKIFFESWDSFTDAGSDLAILSGDNVYGDCYTSECNELEQAYNELAALPPFKRFVDKVPFVATWDDHDYGVNNGDADFAGKVRAKELFLDFYSVPQDDSRRTHGGVYTSYMFGPEGKKVQVILLDQRWFMKMGTTILGDEQWAWLAAEFAKPADLRLVVASFQFMGNLYEGWYQDVCEQKKMLSILPDNVIFISGDRHVGAFYQLDAFNSAQYGLFKDDKGKYVPPLHKSDYKNLPLIEITASSLTHAWNEAGDEPGPNRIPGYDLVKTDHFGQLDIDWVHRKVVASLVPSNLKNSAAKAAEIGSTMTIEFAFPAAKPATPRMCPSGCCVKGMENRRLLFALLPHGNCVDCTCEEPEPVCPMTPLVKSVCVPFDGKPMVPVVYSTATVATTLGDEIFTSSKMPDLIGSHPVDSLLREVSPNITMTALATTGEYGALSLDSMWQVPSKWQNTAFLSGPVDGAGIKVLAKGLLRYYYNNEVGPGRGMDMRMSNVEHKGDYTGQAFPNKGESYGLNGAAVRFMDMEVEYKSSTTTYSHVANGVAMKRIFITTDAKPTGELVQSASHFKNLTKLDALARFCGGSYHVKQEFTHLKAGAGFVDEMYIGGHEDGTYPGFFILDTANTGNLYVLKMPAQVETVTPIYTGNSDYIALVVSCYPEAIVGQRMHLWIGKKTGTDFLSRNGLNAMYARHYMLVRTDAGLNWDDMGPSVDFNMEWVPVDSMGAKVPLSSGSKKMEWSSYNPNAPHMYAMALEGLKDIGVVKSSFPDFAASACSKNGVKLPCTVPGQFKRLGVNTVIDTAFSNPDSVYWSPKGVLMIGEDGGRGRLLRLGLDAAGNTDNKMSVIARIADETLRTQLNSVPAYSFSRASQAEFTGIVPAGYWHLLKPTDGAAKMIEVQMASREQYIVNLQLHSLATGIITAMGCGEGGQTIRVDIEPDPTDAAAAMYAWSGVAYYNGKRAAYCAANDCAGMRGVFVPGEAVRVGDWAILEVWRGLAAGTYTDDLTAIIAESLTYKNMEMAMPYAWSGVGYYNGKRAAYCAANDCSVGVRGVFVPGAVVLESDWAALEKWLGLAAGTYTDDLTAIIAESLGYKNMEMAMPYTWSGIGYYNGKRAAYCAANACTAGMRGDFVPGAVVLESDWVALEKWLGLAAGTYTDDLTAIIAESLGYKNMEAAGF